ncbi:MAG: CSLREA domain-containing protein [Anaerolineae bacterium]|nr:CSLREA domain-containing protein [Anaerolineae bacterium]
MFIPRRSPFFPVFVTFLLLVSLAILPLPTAHAAGFIVSKTADTNDGVCDADCSLREAMIAANASPGADSIIFSAAAFNPGTITLTSHLPTLTDDLDIAGGDPNKVILHGMDTYRPFNIAAGVTVSLSGLTIRDGFGGSGANILNHGALTISNSVIYGAAIIGFASGGGIFNTGWLTLDHTRLYNNSASTGGGLLNDGGVADILYSTIYTNTAGSGAGIANLGGGIVNLYNSTVHTNTAASSAGGIENVNSTLRLVNSTVSGNIANGALAGHGGGALYSHFGSPYVLVINSTITDNGAVQGGRSGVWADAGNFAIQNSIVAGNNGANNCDLTGATVFDNGGNMDDSFSCGFGGTSYSNTNPLLGTLSSANGGPTPTHTLLPGSPAINAGINGNAIDPSGGALPTDQRGPGYARILNGTVDIGAVEVGCPIFPHTVPAGDTTNLNQAITCANSNGPGTNDVIRLTASTYTLTTPASGPNGLPLIVNAAVAGALTLHGEGATIARSSAGGTPDFRILEVGLGGNLSIDNITLSNGRLTSSAYSGANIHNNLGTLTMTNSLVTGGTASGTQGGGVGNFGGTTTITTTTISGNNAADGGGLYNGGGGVMTVRESTVSGNVAALYGGGIANEAGTLNLINSTVAGNAANGSSPTLGGGGALDIWGTSSVLIVNSTLADNSAVQSTRSGIWLEAGTLDLYNSIVAINGVAHENCEVGGGTLTDGGGNLDSGATCGFGVSSYSNFNPQLGALADNGGPTQTMALLIGSPALDSGINGSAVDHAGVTLSTDQRGAGFPRIFGGLVDIGAFEAETAPLYVVLTLEGRPNPAPHPSRVVNVYLRITPSAGGSPILLPGIVTDASSMFTLNALPVGDYTLWLKGEHTLARQTVVTVFSGGTVFVTLVMKEGDATNNNVVNIGDFSLLAAAFGTSQGQPTYDARADFNDDNVVSISDFSLLAANFSQIGDGGILP